MTRLLGSRAERRVRQIQRKFLLGSRWTAVVAIDEGERARHFEVIACTDEVVTLRALLGGELELPISALDDLACWATGWRSLLFTRRRPPALRSG